MSTHSRFLGATKRDITGYRDEHEQPIPPRPGPEPFRSTVVSIASATSRTELGGDGWR